MNSKAPGPTGFKVRQLLTKVRTLALNSPLAKRLLANSMPLPADAPVSPEDVRDLTPERALAMVEALDPAASWSFYAQLPVSTQEFIAAKVSTKRWGSLLINEIHAQAIASAKAPATAQPTAVRLRAGSIEFKRMPVTCRGCGWHGVGSDTKVSELFDSGITEHVCPACAADIAITTWPTLAEYHAHWNELSGAEREYVFLIEKASHESEAKPSH